jgi:hypothetical protein
MNEVARDERGKWTPGKSGNPNGRPASSRQKIAERLIADIAEIWGRRGAEVLEKLATEDPARFATIAYGLVPKDILLSVTQRLPGNMDPDDWHILMDVAQAVKQALPDANQRQPGAVLSFVLDAVRAHSAVDVSGQ